MRVSVSIGFRSEDTKNLMKVMADLKKCSRKGFFRKKSELKMNVIVMDNVDEVSTVIDEVQNIGKVSVLFRSLDRSRRDGGDIYWTRAEDNETLTNFHEKFRALADKKGYSYSKKNFKPRVELANLVIARPDFTVEPFEAEATSVAVYEVKEFMSRTEYVELYKKDI